MRFRFARHPAMAIHCGVKASLPAPSMEIWRKFQIYSISKGRVESRRFEKSCPARAGSISAEKEIEY
jgi:hypothetical protein